MILDHISDTHGQFPKLSPRSQLVVHSGDFMPNLAKGPSEVVFDREVEYQEWWIRENFGEIMSWLGDRYMLLCPGNHDFFDPVPLLKEKGLAIHNLNQQRLEFDGFSFYGLPFVPWLAGRWNYEMREEEMAKEVKQIGEVDILVAHCPPAGILDWTDTNLGYKAGNSSLANWLSYECKKLPQYLLCGHFHGSYGINNLNGLLVSNAATRCHSFEI